jgi:fatty-acid peroxygenase
MLTPVLCMQGEEAARLFYQPGRFTRRGGLPASALRLLQDRGSVLTLDGRAHAWRKALFLSLMTPDAVAALGDAMEREWRRALAGWIGAGQVVLHTALEAVIARAVFAWVGLPPADASFPRRLAEIRAMIDGAGRFGPPNWRASLLRWRCEVVLRDAIHRIRDGRQPVPEDCPAARIAAHRDEAGRLLRPAIAAIELLNLLRPTVAVARYLVFAALMLHRHPERRSAILSDAAARTRFVQEVRRLCPFVPFMGAKALQPFSWRGQEFRRGDWVLLDLYGTNRDPRLWPDPDRFDPDRFRDRPIGAFDFVPQGGGDPATGHRCPGEAIALTLLQRGLGLLAGGMRYAVAPGQDLTVDLDRIPALPRSGFVIEQVEAA